ncbi:hypothetical protein F4803DRAFT_536133 [Xylaria telfairii]|nr:hypothetical protein F4803DRAFT_536133 [Xylaria telfairii]
MRHRAITISPLFFLSINLSSKPYDNNRRNEKVFFFFGLTWPNTVVFIVAASRGSTSFCFSNLGCMVLKHACAHVLHYMPSTIMGVAKGRLPLNYAVLGFRWVRYLPACMYLSILEISPSTDYFVSYHVYSRYNC